MCPISERLGQAWCFSTAGKFQGAEPASAAVRHYFLGRKPALGSQERNSFHSEREGRREEEEGRRERGKGGEKQGGGMREEGRSHPTALGPRLPEASRHRFKFRPSILVFAAQPRPEAIHLANFPRTTAPLE